MKAEVRQKRRQNFVRESQTWVDDIGMHPHIVTAWYVGERLRPGAERDAVTLLTGLAVVFVATNLPVFGGLLGFLVILLGLGVIGQWARGLWAARPA